MSKLELESEAQAIQHDVQLAVDGDLWQQASLSLAEKPARQQLLQSLLEDYQAESGIEAGTRARVLHRLDFLTQLLGNLDQALGLYRQSLEIVEGLGDLQGKAMTLGMMSQVFWGKKNYKEAIASLWSGLRLLVNLNIEPRTQQSMAADMAGWHRQLGAEKFDAFWRDVTGQEVPEWLSQSSGQAG